MKIGFRRKDALCRLKASVVIDQISVCVEVNLATLTDLGYYQILNVAVSHSYIL